MQPVTHIHGGSLDNSKPATVGLLETLNSRCKDVDILDYMSKPGSCKKMKKLFAKLYRKELKDYERSSENMFRSIALYYSNGIMGKKKYRSVYVSVSSKSSPLSKKRVRMNEADCPIPRLVPYHRLTSYINGIDIGKLYSVQDELCDKLMDAIVALRNYFYVWYNSI